MFIRIRKLVYHTQIYNLPIECWGKEQSNLSVQMRSKETIIAIKNDFSIKMHAWWKLKRKNYWEKKIKLKRKSNVN